MTRRAIKPIGGASTSRTEHLQVLITAAALRRSKTPAAQCAGFPGIPVRLPPVFNPSSSWQESAANQNPSRSDHDFHQVVFFGQSDRRAATFQPGGSWQILEAAGEKGKFPTLPLAPLHLPWLCVQVLCLFPPGEGGGVPPPLL